MEKYLNPITQFALSLIRLTQRHRRQSASASASSSSSSGSGSSTNSSSSPNKIQVDRLNLPTVLVVGDTQQQQQQRQQRSNSKKSNNKKPNLLGCLSALLLRRQRRRIRRVVVVAVVRRCLETPCSNIFALLSLLAPPRPGPQHTPFRRGAHDDEARLSTSLLLSPSPSQSESQSQFRFVRVLRFFCSVDSAAENSSEKSNSNTKATQ